MTNRHRFSPLNRWTPERVERVKELHKIGAGPAEIANALGVSRNSAIGVLHRIKNGTYDREPRDLRGAPCANNFAYYASLQPAETPYAADSSCPDYAWDERHCAAINALGGYPVLQIERTRR